MKQMPARKKFKEKFGQSNHYLITSLIGLDRIDKTTTKPDGFATSWNPKDINNSVGRSRIFLLSAFSAHAVDSLDLYFNHLNRRPKLNFPEEIQSVLDQRSIYNKAIELGPKFNVDPLIIALIDVLITWRNISVHSLADNKVKESSRTLILDNKDRIANEFNSLDASNICAKAENGDGFTFKEVCSLVHACHLYVEQFDKNLIVQYQNELFSMQEVLLIKKMRVDLNFRRRYYGGSQTQVKNLITPLLIKDLGFCSVDDTPALLSIALEKVRENNGK